MPCCCAFGCRNRTEDGKKLFCIPRGKQNLTRRKVWLHRIGRKDFEPSASARLCEDHFTEDQFEPIILKNTGEKKLRPFATPSIFLHRPVAKPRKPPPKRTRVDSTDDPKVKQNTQADVEPQPVDTENDVSDMQPDPQIPAPFQPESTQAGQLIQAALQKRVAQLETQLQATRRKLQLAQRQRLQALTANKRLVAGLNKYLNEDQVKCLKMATMQGTRWTKKTVIKALKMRLSCGARGYDSVRELGQPLPTERTLHRHLEGYKFTPGLLEDIMESLALKVSLMSPEERHATLMLDEMQLAPGLVYNPSSGTVLGAPTIPLADATLPPDSLATHGLVFMLGGITTRWKQTVAYHLTGNSFHAKTVKDIIIVIIRACEAISLKVDVVVTDMGGGNQAVWKLFGIIVGKHSKPKTWCPHPCDASRQLFFMADVPHLLKNLRSHLTKGQKIYLPEEVVKKNNLPGNEISIEPVKKLVEIDSNAELKLAPHLKPSSVDPSHYDKMKVGPAFSLINSDTAAAVRLLVDNGTLDKSALTTAWFLELMFRWFRLMTSRTTKLALSHFDDVEYGKALQFLEETIALFEKICIGDEKKATWKPVQTGVILATTSVLLLQAMFLEKYNFKFLLLSRFSQDALENLFSTLRCKNPVPRVLEFKSSLRAATMAQFLRPSKDGSYTEEDCFLLTGMADDNKPNESKMYVVRPSDLLDIQDLEHESLEYLAGYVVAQVKKANSCQACVEAITSSAEGNKLTMLKCYNKEKPALTVPSPAVLKLIETAENYVRLNEEALIVNRVSASKLQSTIQSSLYLGNCFPTCHCISDKLLATFLRTRISILVKKKNHLLMSKIQSSQKCGSRSIGMHVAADSIR